MEIFRVAYDQLHLVAHQPTVSLGSVLSTLGRGIDWGGPGVPRNRTIIFETQTAVNATDII